MKTSKPTFDEAFRVQHEESQALLKSLRLHMQEQKRLIKSVALQFEAFLGVYNEPINQKPEEK